MESAATEHGDGPNPPAPAAWPPPGWVTEVAAARRMGISEATLRAWQRKGRFAYAGERLQAPDNRWWRLYAVAEVDRAYQAMRRAAGDPADSIEAANVWPPAGFVDGYEVARLCQVDRCTIKVWARQGRLTGGRLVKRPGERAQVRVFPEAQVRQLVDAVRAERAAPFPPPGYVDRYAAAALFRVQVNQFNIWIRKGRIDLAGKTVMSPGGAPAKVYEIAAIERARAELAEADAAARRAPDGFLYLEAAARFLDVHSVTLNKWLREGLVRGAWLDLPGGRGRRRVYAVAELERARERMRADAERPTAPPGFVELREVARALGVHVSTVAQWERHGEIAKGRTVPVPGTSARAKVYPAAEVDRLRAAIRTAGEHFPPDGWLEMKDAARRAAVSVEVWKKWLMDGRVENWRWARRPIMARCKLFAVEEIDRVVAELGRDHQFFMLPDGRGGWRPPDGYVGRADAAAIFGVAQGTFVHWQSEGRITCGRWARVPAGVGAVGAGGRRVYPVDELRRLAEEFSRVGKPYVDPADPAVARVPIMSWGTTRFEALIDAADLPLIDGMRWNWAARTRRDDDHDNPDADADADANHDPDPDPEDALIVRSAPCGGQNPPPHAILGIRGPQWAITHRNGDPLDCRRANLVVRDRTHTNAHARKRKVGYGGRPPTSRFKGVCWIERSGKWLAAIQKEGTARRLGYFDDEIAAAQAYDEAARELFGEHARPNFPDGIDAWLERAAAAAAAA